MYPLNPVDHIIDIFLLALDPENARTLLINMRALVPTIFKIMLDTL